ncbi:MAG: hypothetical protein JO202_00350 [Ktedonobacteraceae bacterium]|nr:hypothetical protein [Ktedonobacteraceae bacterium]
MHNQPIGPVPQITTLPQAGVAVHRPRHQATVRLDAAQRVQLRAAVVGQTRAHPPNGATGRRGDGWQLRPPRPRHVGRREQTVAVAVDQRVGGGDHVPHHGHAQPLGDGGQRPRRERRPARAVVGRQAHRFAARHVVEEEHIVVARAADALGERPPRRREHGHRTGPGGPIVGARPGPDGIAPRALLGKGPQRPVRVRDRAAAILKAGVDAPWQGGPTGPLRAHAGISDPLHIGCLRKLPAAAGDRDAHDAAISGNAGVLPRVGAARRLKRRIVQQMILCRQCECRRTRRGSDGCTQGAAQRTNHWVCPFGRGAPQVFAWRAQGPPLRYTRCR